MMSKASQVCPELNSSWSSPKPAPPTVFSDVGNSPFQLLRPGSHPTCRHSTRVTKVTMTHGFPPLPQGLVLRSIFFSICNLRANDLKANGFMLLFQIKINFYYKSNKCTLQKIKNTGKQNKKNAISHHPKITTVNITLVSILPGISVHIVFSIFFPINTPHLSMLMTFHII